MMPHTATRVRRASTEQKLIYAKLGGLVQAFPRDWRQKEASRVSQSRDGGQEVEADDGSGLKTLSVKGGTKLWGESTDRSRKLDKIEETYSHERTRGRSWKMLEQELGCVGGNIFRSLNLSLSKNSLLTF